MKTQHFLTKLSSLFTGFCIINCLANSTSAITTPPRVVPVNTMQIDLHLQDGIQEFLNENALNVFKDGQYTVASEDEEVQRLPTVYFGGNEYYIVNAHENDEITLIASHPYVSRVRFNNSGSTAKSVVYKDSRPFNYLNDKDSQVYTSSRKNLYKDFFKQRPFEWQIVKESGISTASPFDLDKNTSLNIFQKFYLPAGSHKTPDEEFAYAGFYEDHETGYAVHRSAFGDISWLRSAYFDDNTWYVNSLYPSFDIDYELANTVNDISPVCRLPLSSVIFASINEKNKIAITLLDESNNGSSLSDIKGNVYIEKNTAIFYGETLKNDEHISLIGKTKKNEYKFLNAKKVNNFWVVHDDALFNIIDLSVVVCKDGAVDEHNDDYKINYAKTVDVIEQKTKPSYPKQTNCQCQLISI